VQVAAAAQPHGELRPRLIPELAVHPNTSTRPHGSYPGRTLISPTPILAGFRAAAAAAVELCYTRSPEHPLPSNL
jgi:hypothetical protein